MSGARRGLWVAAIAVAAAAAVAALLVGADKLMKPDHGSGLSLITGFLILPLAVLAGLPWSLLALKFSDPLPLAAVILVASVLINGALLGGALAAFRQRRRAAERNGTDGPP
jgi:hypothetical protein